MPLPVPKLDDRQFQNIVDEAKKKIPQYCPEWTDHNVSDPGVTMIELFAWMTDLLLYRVNQVPDLHYIKFMEMLGITLQGPIPAKVPVTFWLSGPQNNPVVIPINTEVASTQTEVERSIIFSTTSDLRIQLPALTQILSRVTTDSQKKAFSEHNIRRFSAGFEGSEIFTKVPQIGDALYFGFENDLSHHILGFDCDFDPAGGAGVDPTLPPYIWEASCGLAEQHWAPCYLEIDSTKGLNVAGRIRIHLPQMGLYNVNGAEHYWVRVRVKEITPDEARQGMRSYKLSPKLRKVTVATWGGRVEAAHAQTINHEYLGQSDGTPGQRFQLKYKPVLQRRPEERLEVHVEGKPPQIWQEVSDFSSSSAEDLHYTLDSLSGEIRFGPAVRQPDGTIKLYGAVPARKTLLIFSSYRSGGGLVGNIQPGVLNTLKTAIPYIAKVSNLEPAWGGIDAETLEAAMMRAPALLRSRERAVTEDDYEFLACQALPAAIGRVKCLQPNPSDAGKIIPGQVFVLVIPRVTQPEKYIPAEALKLKDEDNQKLMVYLDERRLLTTRLDIRPPAYHWVSAKVKCRTVPGSDQARVKEDILSQLYRFLNPLTGGVNGKGWPFGRTLFASDIYQCLQGIPNIQFVRGLDLYNAKPGGEPMGEPVETVEVVPHGVIASGQHSVEFV
jgi:hypothetical protein